MNNYAIPMHNYSSAKKMSIAVVGSSGYSGQELVRLLRKHPVVGTLKEFNSQSVSQLEPKDFQVIFLATPAETSAVLGPACFSAATSVIDLSGAFRLAAKDYPAWYGFQHPRPDLSFPVHYGLVPWESLPEASSYFISNPGCYATSVLMALNPLLKLSVIEVSSIVIDAKSGTTGAGKKPIESQLFSEVEGDCVPYKVGVHQHLPEIQRYASASIRPFFSTSLLPVRRGITTSIYARLAPGKSKADVALAFEEFYAHYPLVTIKDRPSLRGVVGTAQNHLSFTVVDDKLYLFSCIDNLLKGAASQAVENFNRINHLPVTTGLEHLEAII